MLAAPIVTQLRELAEPELMAFGSAVNEVMAGFASFAVKLCGTGVAAAHTLLPPWEALIVQVPAATKVAVVPLMVQILVVCEVNDTVKPELAVADSVNGWPTVWVPGEVNVIVCGSGLTVRLSETGVAAAHSLLPACEA